MITLPRLILLLLALLITGLALGCSSSRESTTGLVPSISSGAADASDWPPPVAKTVLRTEPKKVYISSGIKAGTQIITTTLEAPVPGTKLAIHKPAPQTLSVSPVASEQ